MYNTKSSKQETCSLAKPIIWQWAKQNFLTIQKLFGIITLTTNILRCFSYLLSKLKVIFRSDFGFDKAPCDYKNWGTTCLILIWQHSVAGIKCCPVGLFRISSFRRKEIFHCDALWYARITFAWISYTGCPWETVLCVRQQITHGLQEFFSTTIKCKNSLNLESKPTNRNNST